MIVLGKELYAAVHKYVPSYKNRTIALSSLIRTSPTQIRTFIPTTEKTTKNKDTSSILRKMLVGLALSIIPLSMASASPLSSEKCKELSEQQKTLKTDPIVMQMEKGFEWVKQNIKGDALLPIKQYLDVEDQLKFRCPNKAKPKSKTPKKPESSDLKKVKKTDSINKAKPVAPKKPTKIEIIQTKPEPSPKQKKSSSVTPKVTPQAKSDEKSVGNTLIDGLISALSNNKTDNNISEKLGKSVSKNNNPAAKAKKNTTTTTEKPVEDNSVHPFF